MANYALLEWPENIAISDRPPSEYIPQIRGRFSAGEWKTMSDLHGLPENWENMGYQDFLQERRRLMAGIIRQGFQTLV